METKKIKNFPAFPCDGEDFACGRDSVGMTLRDYFAGQALTGLISIKFGFESESSDETCKICAFCAYELADAMLVERQNRKELGDEN